MNIRQSVLGEIATRSGNEVIGVDLGALLGRLLLFDTVVVKSVGLREISFLIRTFGRLGFLQLINSGVLKLSCEFLAIITAVARDGVPTVPPCHFTFGIAELTEREKKLREGLRSLQGIPGLGNSMRQNMEETIISNLVRPKPDYGPRLQAQLESDIRNNTPALRLAVEGKLREAGALPQPFDIRVEETQSRVFHIITNLSNAYGFPEQKTHDLLQTCVSGIATLDQRIADMEAYSSITGFTESEAPLLFGKFAGIIASQNPEPIEKQFARVITLANFPDFVSGRRVDVEKLLRVRESPECLEFRSWLTSLENVPDKEITDMIGGMKNKLGALVKSGPGKAVRLAATTAIGSIPGGGFVASAIAALLDSFLVDRIFATSGVVAFLTQTYPSIFDERPK
jgi:hypothetical protein